MNKVKAKKQSNSGITLIALVITIIIMLILAGITINLTIGQDGIINRAQDAEGEYEKAQLKEELELAILDIRTDKLSQGQSITREDLMGLEKIGAVMESIGIPAEGEYKNYFFEIDENYNVTIVGNLEGERPTITGEILVGIIEEGKSVEIKVKANVSSSSIKTIEATNGAILKEDVSSTEKIFSVNSNGTYYFKALSNNGRSAILALEVNCIQKKPEIVIKEITKDSFIISIVNNYNEELITQYKYYINGVLQSEGTNNKEYKVTELLSNTEYKNIYIEAYVGTDNLVSNIVSTKTKEVLLEELKAGDYVSYNSGTNGIITFRVLYPLLSQYGLQIVSDKSVKNVTIGSTNANTAKSSYNNAINQLNNEALLYKNETYAIDARSIGSNPINKNSEIAGPVSLPFSYKGSWTIDCKNTDENNNADYQAMKASNIYDVGVSYWIASRNIGSRSDWCGFELKISDSSVGIYHIYPSGGAVGQAQTFGFRPCITLKQTIKITGGNGISEKTAYTLGT